MNRRETIEEFNRPFTISDFDKWNKKQIIKVHKTLKKIHGMGKTLPGLKRLDQEKALEYLEFKIKKEGW